MARSNFGPEVKSAMDEKPKPKQPPGSKGKRPPDKGETTADRAMDVKRGIAEGSPQDVAMDAQSGGSASMGGGMSPPPGSSVSQHNASANPAHAAMAASIAHSILQHGR